MSDEPFIELCDSLRGLEAWQADALCREYPHLDYFPERGQPVAEQLQVCGRCLVRVECLEHALAVPEYSGIWGGHSAVSLRGIRRLRTLRRRAGLPELHAADLEHAARRHPSTGEADDAA